MKRNFIRDQTGEGYIDVAITILIIFTLMASLMALFPIFTAQQSLNRTAQYMPFHFQYTSEIPCADADIRILIVNGSPIAGRKMVMGTVFVTVTTNNVLS